MHLTRFHQCTNRWPAQSTDPVQPRWFDLVADACLGQHAAVADQHHPRPSETAAELVDLHAHGGRVGGVAIEHLDRHRTPLGVAQQAELELQLAALGVVRMTVFGQRAAAPFQIHRGQVIEHQCPVVEVMPGQASLNGVLAFEQPVHGRVEIVLVALAKGERFGQRVTGGVGRQAAGGGQFRLGVEDACDDEGQHPVALRTVLSTAAT